jgi:uncharacterized protein YndB with AHSA1/START domain
MTQQKSLKRRVRARMTKTGERYTSARRQLLSQASAPIGDAAAASPAPVREPGNEVPDQVPDSPFRGGYGASDEALVQRTGHEWAHWYRLLDGWGAADRPHPEIARWLHVDQGVDGWWSQELTVRYEMAIGRRVPGQRPDGFEASASKTIGVPVERVFAAFVEGDQRAQWLTRPVHLRVATPYRTARFDWEEASQRIVVGFQAKGERTTVSLAHQRMPDAETSAAMKAFWRTALQDLAAYLDGGT